MKICKTASERWRAARPRAADIAGGAAVAAVVAQGAVAFENFLADAVLAGAGDGALLLAAAEAAVYAVGLALVLTDTFAVACIGVGSSHSFIRFTTMCFET